MIFGFGIQELLPQLQKKNENVSLLPPSCSINGEMKIVKNKVAVKPFKQKKPCHVGILKKSKRKKHNLFFTTTSSGVLNKSDQNSKIKMYELNCEVDPGSYVKTQYSYDDILGFRWGQKFEATKKFWEKKSYQ